MALAALIIYFGFQGFTGERGLLTSGQRGEALVGKAAELRNVRIQRHDLERRALLLRDQAISADLLEERAHSLLGYVDPRDYVIRTE